MSTGQKSFFDQTPVASKPKYQQPQKLRTGCGSDGNYLSYRADGSRRTAASIPLSTRTKSKLKSFQFIEDSTPKVPNLRTKDTNPSIQESKLEMGADNMAVDMYCKESIPPQPSDLHYNATSTGAILPSTPAPRLPLADLVRNSGDTESHPQSSMSPEDHVFWEHDPCPSTLRRGKKRARSSSPATSSQSQTESIGKKFNLQQMQQLLKTPQADPAIDLWNRYNTNAQSRNSSTVKKSVNFAHLINNVSSPHSIATPDHLRGLRRWTSCANDFPASASKRRRPNGRYVVSATEQSAALNIIGEDWKVTGSKAEKLLQQIQRTIPKPITPKYSGAPSSSSPLPETSDYRSAAQTSPLQNMKRPARVCATRAPTMDNMLQEMDEEEREWDTRDSATSSDYGEGDLDQYLVEEMGVTCGTSNTPTEKTLRQAEIQTERHTQQQQQQHHHRPDARAGLTKQSCSGTDDEFDLEDENDIFGIDLEAVAPNDEGKSAQSVAAVVGMSGQAETRIASALSIDDSTDDEFGGLDDIDEDQLALAVAHATQVCRSQSECATRILRTIEPCLVFEVQNDLYHDGNGHKHPQKILTVKNERRKFDFLVILRQAWIDTPCITGSYIHVVGESTPDGHFIIDDMNNLLVLHPDQLLSATTVSESSDCIRRSVLRNRIKTATQKSNALVYGNLLHELFQEAMKSNQWDDRWLEKCARDILPRHYEDLLEIGISVEQAVDHLRSKAVILREWAKVFVQPEPGPTARVAGPHGQETQLSISKLLDVEENILSPVYGLKGKVDATIEVSVKESSGARTLTVPFELKTGKENASHRAQTALYTLLLSDRYDIEITFGILWNLETCKMSSIQAVRHLIRPLIMRRNELANFLRDRSSIPPMLTDYVFCHNCQVRDACFVYNKLEEGGDGANLRPNVKEKFNELVKYLRPNHAEFFSKWQNLLSQEEADMTKYRNELWTMLSVEREKLGRAFSNVVIEPASFEELKDGSKISRFRYSFVKAQRSVGFSFAESQLVVGEPIVVSDEAGHYALAKGFVIGIHRQRITVTVDRKLHNARRRKPGFDTKRNQVFMGIKELGGSVDGLDSDGKSIVYRLDKDEFENGMGIPRNNLLQLMNDGIYKASDLRTLIVDGRAPSFKDISSTLNPASQSGMAMNLDQKAAIQKVMSAQDYALVLGMPGTGKTTTIAKIIRTLVASGKSVLLTSFQHSAVDNILLKIRNDKIPILRLGAVSKVLPQVREFAILAEEPKGSISDLEYAWMATPVVAATCLKVDHPVFNRRTFDYCIVDEASQITLPTCLGPIRMANIFVLVGDHHQLPPLVQNRDALAGGLDMSLFRLLSEQHPEAVVNLEHQYRMAGDIMLLSNTLIYSGRLKCGTEAVENQTLQIPDPAGIELCHSSYDESCPSAGPQHACVTTDPSKCYISRALQPTTRVLFLNTDGFGNSALEVSSEANGNRITNPLEATILSHLTAALLNTGVSAQNIGHITPFRSQLSLLKDTLRTVIPNAIASHIELNTADKYQGRDKSCILVSFVRSNATATVGELLKDERRINVAITRAQSKLVLVGSRKTLSGGSELLASLVRICDEKGWVWNLNSGAIDSHSFEGLKTQLAETQTGHLEKVQETSPSRNLSAATQTISSRKPLSPLKSKSVNGRANNGSSKLNRPFKPPQISMCDSLGGSQRVMRRPGNVMHAKQSALSRSFEKRGGQSVMRDLFYDAI